MKMLQLYNRFAFKKFINALTHFIKLLSWSKLIPGKFLRLNLGGVREKQTRKDLIFLLRPSRNHPKEMQGGEVRALMRGWQGITIPRALDHCMGPKHCWERRNVPTLSQMQYIFFRKRTQVRTLGLQTCFLTWAPSNPLPPWVESKSPLQKSSSLHRFNFTLLLFIYKCSNCWY